MHAFLLDLRHAIRLLGARPGFTLVVVLTLALGIGANTAIFSVVNAVLLRPLPYREPDRLVALWETQRGDGDRRSRGTVANILDWQAQNDVFETMAMFGSAGGNLTDGTPEQVLGARVSRDYFTVLGVEPMIGRTFAPEEFDVGADRVVIIYHDLWQRRFGGDPDVIGKTLRMDDRPYTVVGVMPTGIYPTWPATQAYLPFLPRYQQIWLPMALTAEQSAVRTSHVMGTIARLRPGMTLSDARTNMETIAARLERAYPAANRDEGVVVVPLVDEVVGNVRTALMILVGAVALVLLVACANLASLMLARSIARRKELSIRVALGAGRARLVRQLIVESLLLAALGGIAGVGVASLGLDVVTAATPQDIPRLDDVGIDRVVLLFASAVTVVTAGLFGLLPAWRATRGDVQRGLQDTGRSHVAGGRDPVRRLLIVAEVATAVLLVIGAGLLVRSFWNLQRVDVGFDPSGTLALEVALPDATYGDAPQILGFQNAVVERLGGIAGVQSVAIAYDTPLEATWGDVFRIEGRPEPEPGRLPGAWLRPVSPGYFRTTGIELRRGRDLNATDDLDHPGALVVNEAFVRRYFPDEDAIGRHVHLQRHWRYPTPERFEIVGVVEDVRFLGPDREAAPAYYRPFAQFPESSFTILVKVEVDPLSIIGGARDVVASIDPALPLGRITTMDQQYAAAIAQPRFNMLLLTLFGGVALLLATIGIYGLLAHHVAQRTRELGVRMALGASAADVARLVLGEGAWLTGTGVALGLAASVGATRLLGSLLFGVSPVDLPTFGGVILGLGVIALLASYLPARRASRIDPMVALRME